MGITTYSHKYALFINEAFNCLLYFRMKNEEITNEEITSFPYFAFARSRQFTQIVCTSFVLVLSRYICRMEYPFPHSATPKPHASIQSLMSDNNACFMTSRKENTNLDTLASLGTECVCARALSQIWSIVVSHNYFF